MKTTKRVRRPGLSTAAVLRQHAGVSDVPAPAPDDLAVPLCVDLDGTLLNTDMLWESLKDAARRRPWVLLLVPVWLLQGRAHLKRRLAARAQVDPATLPFHHGFVAFLRDEKARGRRLVLATASDQALAERIAERFDLFAEVLGSDGRRNLRGRAKAAVLTERFGLRGFDYAGNSAMDLNVWVAARQAIVVNASAELLAQARQRATVARVFPEEPGNPCRTPW